MLSKLLEAGHATYLKTPQRDCTGTVRTVAAPFQLAKFLRSTAAKGRLTFVAIAAAGTKKSELVVTKPPAPYLSWELENH